MYSSLRLTIMAGFMALAFATAAAAPLAGRWEGSLERIKAVSLDLRDAPALEGSVVFYIVRSSDGKKYEGTASPAQPMLHPKWDGQVLRFDIAVDDRSVAFEMRPAGDGKATLTRLAAGDIPELTIPLSALR